MGNPSNFVPSPGAAKPAKRPSGSTPPTVAEKAQPTSTPSTAKPSARLTGTQLATAFQGKLEPRRLSLGYRIGLLAIAGMMILMPIVYFAIIAGTAWATIWWASHGSFLFEATHNVRVLFLAVVVYAAPIIAGGVLVLTMLSPLFWRSAKRGPKPFWVSRSEQALLYAYVDSLCDTMRAPRPTRIDIVAAAVASAHIDNGLFGVVHRKLVLTIGLPLPATMTLRQFTGVLAHELGHFSQGSSMRLSFLIQRVNMWFGRMGYARNGMDDVIDGMLSGDEVHWSFLLVGGLCKLVVGIARLVLKALAFVSHALTMGHSRAAEFDADHQAARIVGSNAMGDALQTLPATDLAFAAAIERAQKGWTRKQLPDDLVAFTRGVDSLLTPDARQKLLDGQLSAETSWFDTHPPLLKRVGALMKAKLSGAMKIDGPATVLFKDFDELSKMATIDLYQSILGGRLQPEHLVPTPEIIAKPPVAK